MGVTSQIVVSPSTVALAQGAAFQITATPEDTNGAFVSNATVSFTVTDGGSVASVSVNGLICAGRWDSLITPIVCTPSTTYGRAIVTASVGSVTQDVIVNVLPPIDAISVSPAPLASLDPAGLDCVSQTPDPAAPNTHSTRTYTAQAFFRGNPVDLSTIPDAVSWTVSSPGFGTIATPNTITLANGKSATDTRSGIITAQAPGKTQVVASLARLQSTPVDFITCPVRQITIADSASPATAMPVSSGTTVTLTPTIIDSRGNSVNLTSTDSAGTVTTLFGLLWNSSEPVPATVGTTGIVTPSTTGGTTAIVASCTPPGCNFGLGSVYSKPFLVSVTGTSSTVVYVGSKAPAPDSNTAAPGKTLLPITTTGDTVGTAISLPDVPNSMMFNSNGSALYIGTASGLVTLATSNNGVTTANTGAPGKVLAVSPDGNAIVVSDLSHLYVVNSAGIVQTFDITGVTAADFPSDSSKAFIVGGDQFTVYAPGAFPVPQSLLGASDVSFLTSSAFGLIGNDSGINLYATCNNLNTLLPFPFPDNGTTPLPVSVPGISTAPAILRSLPDGSHVLAVNSPNVSLIGVDTDNKGFLSSDTGCAPAVTSAAPVSATFTSFTPNQLIVTPDGTKAFVTSNVGQLIGVTISGNTIAPAPITLSGGVAQTTGGVTLDSKQLYVGGSDNKVHHVDLTTGNDTPITLSSAPAGFTTDFVAVQPH